MKWKKHQKSTTPGIKINNFNKKNDKNMEQKLSIATNYKNDNKKQKQK